MKRLGKFIPPVLPQSEIDAITSPENGEVVYNSTLKSLSERIDSSSNDYHYISFDFDIAFETIIMIR